MPAEYADHELDPHSEQSPAAAKLSWLSIMTKLALVVLAGLVLFGIVQRRGNFSAEGQRGPAIGKTLTRLDLQALATQERVELPKLSGKVVLINFWGPWCYYCREEFPGLIDLHQQFKQRSNFQFISVTCGPSLGDDTSELESQTVDYLKKVGATFPVYLDPAGTSRRAVAEVAESQNFGFPTTLILDRQGIIRGFWLGFRHGDEQQMRALLEELLGAT